MAPVITLTTDFGLDDPFAGIMKGVILGIAPEARIVDITHAVEPGNLKQAAHVLEAAHPWFPAGTVHCVVVDPGVGSGRRALAVQSGGAFFVAPDNGVLTPVLTPRSKAVALANRKYFLKNVSATFHGRDVFAPVAAWIAKGTSLAQMGNKITDPVTLALPRPETTKTGTRGEIVHIDRFGNLMSNLKGNASGGKPQPIDKYEVFLGKQKIGGPYANYSACKEEEIGWLINSWDAIEIFCREGHAANQLKARVGTKVTLKLKNQTG